MGSALPRMTLQDYLAWEELQAERHEYHRGEIYLMVGGLRTHGRTVHNLSRLIGNALAASPCQVFSESMKLNPADDFILYPDLFVTCDRNDLRTDRIFSAPTVVIEVLSPSTQAYDRSLKFALYRQVKSLKEYVLVDPDTKRVELFRINDEALWVLHDFSGTPALKLASLQVEVPLVDIFDGVDPPPEDEKTAEPQPPAGG